MVYIKTTITHPKKKARQLSLNTPKRRGRERVDNLTLTRMRQLRQDGFGYGKIAAECGIAKATVQMYCRDIKISRDNARGKADNIYSVFDKLMDLQVLLATSGVDIDDLDVVAKQFRQKLSHYDDETLKLLTKSNQALLSMISKVLTKDTTFSETYPGITGVSITKETPLRIETPTVVLSINKRKLLPSGKK